MKNPQTPDNIRVSWSLNCAVVELSALAKETGRWDKEALKSTARKYLEIFDEMIKDLPDEVCESCGGTASITTDGVKEPIINGLHEACRTSEYVFKKKNL